MGAMTPEQINRKLRINQYPKTAKECGTCSRILPSGKPRAAIETSTGIWQYFHLTDDCMDLDDLHALDDLYPHLQIFE